MASICFGSVRGSCMRVLSLNECCAAVDKVCGVIQTTGFVQVTLTQEIEEGTEVLVKRANGTICIYDPGCSSLKSITAEIEFCRVDPELLSVLTGDAVVLDYAGNAVGTQRTTDLNCANRFSLEVWSDVPGLPCSGTVPQKQWGYFLLPCLRDGIISGSLTIQDGELTVTVTAKTTTPNAWGQGPTGGTSGALWNVVPNDAANTPAHLLVALPSDLHQHLQLTTIAPPCTGDDNVDCGCLPVDFA